MGDAPFRVEREAMQLRRTMGPLDAVLFFIVASANLQWIAAAAVTGPSSLSVWLIGGAAMFVPLAVVLVSLSRRYPEEGGLYVWSKRAFGPFAGFITGWMYWASNLPYFPALLYFAAGLGLFTTCVAIVFAGVPAASDPDKTLAVVKIAGSTALILAAGAVVYRSGRRRAQRLS